MNHSTHKKHELSIHEFHIFNNEFHNKIEFNKFLRIDRFITYQLHTWLEANGMLQELESLNMPNRDHTPKT